MKATLIAASLVLAGLSGVATAAPTIQTCGAMEVTQNSNIGLSYTMLCQAGGWNLKYTGSIPAGNEPVAAQYRLDAARQDGAKFTMNRTVNTPAPAHLGRMLVREAVLLDNGELALRDCQEFACTLYRPVGFKGNLSKATVTVTPEVKRLTDERAQLADALKTRTAELDAQTKTATSLKDKVSVLEKELADTKSNLVKTAATAADAVAKATTTHAAELAALQNKTAAEAKKAQETCNDMIVSAVEKEKAADVRAQGELKGLLAQANQARDYAVAQVTAGKKDLQAAADKWAAQDSAYKETIANLQKVNGDISSELAKLRTDLAAAQKAAEAVKAYDFVIKDLVAQHAAQVTAVRQALPDTNFGSMLQDLVVPTVAAQQEPVKAVTLPAVITPPNDKATAPTVKQGKLLK